MHELIIIGAGPAGITASIYAARKQMKFLLISRDIGGQAALSASIENYSSYQFISGFDLMSKFREHLEKYAIETAEGSVVASVEKAGEHFIVTTDTGNYDTKAVLIASGRRPKELAIEGEQQFRGKGVSYCATCDGPLFTGLDVAVAGGGNSALDAVLQLSKTSPRVYLIDSAPRLTADPVLIEKAAQRSNITLYGNTRIKAINGERFVTGVTLVRENLVEEAISLRGVFVEIGYSAASDFVKGVERDERGDVNISCRCETNIPGLFAAGDVTNVSAKQIIVACGEGAKAALQAFSYINKLKSGI